MNTEVDKITPVELTHCCICKRLLHEDKDGGHFFLAPRARGPFGCWIAYTCEDCVAEAQVLHDSAVRLRNGQDIDQQVLERSESLRREMVELDFRADPFGSLMPLDDLTDELVEWDEDEGC